MIIPLGCIQKQQQQQQLTNNQVLQTNIDFCACEFVLLVKIHSKKKERIIRDYFHNTYLVFGTQRILAYITNWQHHCNARHSIRFDLTTSLQCDTYDFMALNSFSHEMDTFYSPGYKVNVSILEANIYDPAYQTSMRD